MQVTHEHVISIHNHLIKRAYNLVSVVYNHKEDVYSILNVPERHRFRMAKVAEEVIEGNFVLLSPEETQEKFPDHPHLHLHGVPHKHQHDAQGRCTRRDCDAYLLEGKWYIEKPEGWDQVYHTVQDWCEVCDDITTHRYYGQQVDCSACAHEAAWGDL